FIHTWLRFGEIMRGSLRAQRLGVKYFPAMMLVDPKQGSVRPLSYGFISQDDLAKQFLNVSEDFKPNF
ncbi:conjugal transfer protein TraF, partial [Escherichia coli]|nr:conjugal transfer protein TraF [Escherichia coli]